MGLRKVVNSHWQHLLQVQVTKIVLQLNFLGFLGDLKEAFVKSKEILNCRTCDQKTNNGLYTLYSVCWYSVLNYKKRVGKTKE